MAHVVCHNDQWSRSLVYGGDEPLNNIYINTHVAIVDSNLYYPPHKMRPSTLPGFFFFFISGKNRILFSSATQEEELDEDSIRLDQASCQVASEDGCEGWSLIDGRWLTLGATATSDRTDRVLELSVFFSIFVLCFCFILFSLEGSGGGIRCREVRWWRMADGFGALMLLS